MKDRYGQIAATETSCCATTTCCGPTSELESTQSFSKRLGYSEKEIESAPAGSNLGLGCGNPTALAALKPGEVVLDLGSGAGFDAFLASRQVGATGKVIGVDMTPEMIEKARRNAEDIAYENVEFRLGEIEDLPITDDSVDVVISNCVVNLAPDKRKVFREAFRALKPGGRLMVADIVLLRELPGPIKSSVQALTGCIAGALRKKDYLDAIRAAGFEDVKIVDECSDIYSLGCVAYWMLTGVLVFEGSTPVGTIVNHAKTPPVLPSQKTELKIPESLEQVILSYLEKDPGNRPQSMVEISHLLAEVKIQDPWTEQRTSAWW